MGGCRQAVMLEAEKKTDEKVPQTSAELWPFSQSVVCSLRFEHYGVTESTKFAPPTDLAALGVNGVVFECTARQFLTALSPCGERGRRSKADLLLNFSIFNPRGVLGGALIYHRGRPAATQESGALSA